MSYTIGLLGGSFNPAHDGHVYISREAKKRLGLDAVWWLVSPGNPLKDHSELRLLAERVAYAQTLTASDQHIKVTDIESRLGTYYTVDTLHALKKCYPDIQFIWLMGADNLANFHRWKGWDKIMDLMPVAVLDRGGSTFQALGSKAAKRFSYSRLKGGMAEKRLKFYKKGWVFIRLRRHPLSSTLLRKHWKNNSDTV